MTCAELTKPRITKDEIRKIILGGGQNLLSPERRFDAIIDNSPELFKENSSEFHWVKGEVTMATQLYSFRIAYTGCHDKIWRTAAVSSNYTLAQLGYLVLATFDTMAYHLFEMKYKDTTYVLTGENFEGLSCEETEKFDLLGFAKIGKLGMHTGDRIEMTYDQGCCQVFEVTLLEIGDMPKGHGRAYPKILDGAGRGIVDDMPPEELAKTIRKIDLDGHSGIQYSSSGFDDVPEWDYRNYSIDLDNALLKGTIERIRDGYEGYEEEYDEY